MRNNNKQDLFLKLICLKFFRSFAVFHFQILRKVWGFLEDCLINFGLCLLNIMHLII